MNIVENLTPHPVVLYPAAVQSDRIESDEQPVLVIQPSSPPARIATCPLGTQPPAGGASVELVEFSHVNGLPPRRDGVRYIVSLVVGLAMAPTRSDLLVPYREVRNDQGTVVGCRQLAQPC